MNERDIGALLVESAWISARACAGLALAGTSVAIVGIHHRARSGPVVAPRARSAGGGVRFAAMASVLVLVAALVGLTRGQLAAWLPLPLQGAVAAVGSLLSLSGAMFAIWAAAALGPNFAVGPLVRGDARAALITSGPFALVRHPLYTAIGLLAAGAALAFASLAGLVALLVLYPPIARARAALEERALAEAWPESWPAYVARTPGFVPRF